MCVLFSVAQLAVQVAMVTNECFSNGLCRKEPNVDVGLAGYNGYDGKNGSSDIDGPPLEVIIK
ncbi:hypothetical protein OAJ52_08045 [Bacteroidia bacterium]|jgi:hypothetical protein|nr:hypothetical protein [Bacteroidia bacterium]|tara:strand:+ start:544 stop:732 length:189 start_codon:yes stop_codon:yes gene_type:complete